MAKLPQKPTQSRAVAAYDYGQDAGAGFENQTQSDRLTPFIRLLQPLSPQVAEKGMKPGHLYNPVTEVSYPELIVIPVVTEHVFVEWTPRDAGGGFVAEHRLDSDFVREIRAASGTRFGKLKTPSGNELGETFKVWVVVVTEDGLKWAILSFDSTKIRVYKKFNDQMLSYMLTLPDGRKVKPPMWAHLTRLGSFQDKNKKGQFWNFTWTFANGSIPDSLLAPDDPRYLAGRELYELYKSDALKADYSSVERTHVDDADDATPF